MRKTIAIIIACTLLPLIVLYVGVIVLANLAVVVHEMVINE